MGRADVFFSSSLRSMRDGIERGLGKGRREVNAAGGNSDTF